MSAVPTNPKIYHITHLRNLPPIIEAESLYSDAKRIELGLDCQIVGMSKIKKRRLEEIGLNVHVGTKVGEYVPFYFCPRSIMLFILHKGDHPDLKYTEGQGPIVHLQADLMKTIAWADMNEIRWAFSDRNAGGYLAEFYKNVRHLDKVNWSAVAAADFRHPSVKEGKQAEFLLWGHFPWKLVEEIGVKDAATVTHVQKAVNKAAHQPTVAVKGAWYF